MRAYDQPDTLYATVHPASIKENWSFSFEARYTVTRITLFRFADTTSMSVPIPTIIPVRGNQLHPRAKQRSTFPRLSPQERQNYITSPLPASTPPKLALGVGHSVPNRKSAPGCKSCVEFRQISFTFMRRKMSWINFFSPPKNRRSQGASRPSVLSFISSSLIVQARSAS